MNVDNRSFWSVFKTRNVTVSVKRRPEEPCAVFRVKNVIDFGTGRQTAMLEGFVPTEFGRQKTKKLPLSMPCKIGSLDVIYTTKNISPMSHIYTVIGDILRRSCMDRIIPEVLAPGDFVVFTKRSEQSGAFIVDALRVMSKTTGKAGYAL